MDHRSSPASHARIVEQAGALADASLVVGLVQYVPIAQEEGLYAGAGMDVDFDDPHAPAPGAWSRRAAMAMLSRQKPMG